MKKYRKVGKIKVIEKKLGRSNVWGFAYEKKDIIEIDSRLKGKKRLKILVHEAAHHAFPNAGEKEIAKAERIIGNVLWGQNYRRVDNSIE